MHLSIINSNATDLLASGSSLGATPGGYTAFYSQTFDSKYYTLSPNTRLEFTADSNLFVDSTSSGGYEYAYAINQSYAYDNLNGQYSNYVYSEIYSNYYDSKAISEMKSVSAFIDNILSQESNGYLQNYAYVYGVTYVEPSAVPVPAALPLMASALGVFGIARRRNKAKAKASL